MNEQATLGVDSDGLSLIVNIRMGGDFHPIGIEGFKDHDGSACKKAGIQRHSVDLSLGIWGKIDKLPDEKIMEITTMCGHGMISANLVSKMIDDIRAGKTTARKAAVKLAEPCACGIFNIDKAEALLNELAAKL